MHQIFLNNSLLFHFSKILKKKAREGEKMAVKNGQQCFLPSLPEKETVVSGNFLGSASVGELSRNCE
jgi:hypothetical protein